jgi:hypothetical protein
MIRSASSERDGLGGRLLTQTPFCHFPFAFSLSNPDFGAIIAPVQFCYTGRNDIE